MSTTLSEKEAVMAAASLLLSTGASQVFVFGSVAKCELRPDSDIDMAVSGAAGESVFRRAQQGVGPRREAR